MAAGRPSATGCRGDSQANTQSSRGSASAWPSTIESTVKYLCIEVTFAIWGSDARPTNPDTAGGTQVADDKGGRSARSLCRPYTGARNSQSITYAAPAQSALHDTKLEEQHARHYLSRPWPRRLRPHGCLRCTLRPALGGENERSPHWTASRHRARRVPRLHPASSREVLILGR